MAKKILLSSMCRACRHKHTSTSTSTPSPFQRAFSTSTTTRAEMFSRLFPQEAKKEALRRAQQPPREPSPLSQQDRPAAQLRPPERAPIETLWQDAAAETSTRHGGGIPSDEPYHLNVFAHKHNIHITFTEPSRNPILSFSCGDIGLKKAQRGTYDAAYQLATYTMRKMAEKQWRQGGKKMNQNPMRTLRDVRGGAGGGNGIEVVLRGYGPGRDAFQKALMGTEGMMIKPLIVKVTDGTRLKFGGTRSPQVRRLG